MKMEVVFVGGPLHRLKAEMTWIPEVQIVCDSRDRLVYAYKRDEKVYFYDAEMSKKLTENYDAVVSAEPFRKNPVIPTGEA